MTPFNPDRVPRPPFSCHPSPLRRPGSPAQQLIHYLTTTANAICPPPPPSGVPPPGPPAALGWPLRRPRQARLSPLRLCRGRAPVNRRVLVARCTEQEFTKARGGGKGMILIFFENGKRDTRESEPSPWAETEKFDPSQPLGYWRKNVVLFEHKFFIKSMTSFLCLICAHPTLTSHQSPTSV